MPRILQAERAQLSPSSRPAIRLARHRTADLYSPAGRRRAPAALCDGGTIPVDALIPDERGRLMICDNDGVPEEPAALWLTEIGHPVQPNSWEAMFARAIPPLRRRRLP